MVRPAASFRAVRLLLPTVALGAALALPAAPPHAAPPLAPGGDGWAALAERVEIVRTTRGIPHVLAEDFEAAGFGLGWVQMEDHGIRVVNLLLSARGESARHYGPGTNDARVTSDLRARRSHGVARARFSELPDDVQAVYRGFATAVNRWLELHPEDAPPSLAHPAFTGMDVLARDVTGPDWGLGERYARRLEGGGSAASPSEVTDGEADPVGYEPGSNTWALAPERTTSGHAILMRNPHLAWTAGYYEAHLVVGDALEFYGDFRVGGPFGIIGGWNARLGWSTTNNNPELGDLYLLELDPADPARVRWEGAWVPLERTEHRIEVWDGRAVETRVRELWESPLGPVVHRGGGVAVVVRSAGDREYRLGAQFLAMMRAESLNAWKDAMRMQARTQSNFTYADADGNIFYVWNALHPVRPHPFGGDTLAHRAAGWDDAWQEILPFDALPQLLNPPGGYLRNENDPFHHTNLNAVLDPADYPAEAEAPRVRLRSQHGLELLHNDRRFSLEDAVAVRGSERMLLAERVMDDLVAALRGGRGGDGWTPLHDEALVVLAGWDRSVAAEARGAVLFVEWWEQYLAGAGRAPGSAASAGFPARAERLFAEPWRDDAPMSTPRGLADPARAVEAFLSAAPATRDRWGAVDVAWGAVHRARHGTLDLPVGGCDGLLGCFRVLWFDDDADGRRRVRGGDGWISVVEFGARPRGWTVLAYGQSSRPGSPWHEDQLEDFVHNRMTPVAWTPEEVARDELSRYRPGTGRGGGPP